MSPVKIDKSENNTAVGSFSRSYSRLKEIANALEKQQGDPNIDELGPMVEEAVECYQTCKDRIDSVEKLIREKLEPLSGNSREKE